jgi:hypothetical protein
MNIQRRSAGICALVALVALSGSITATQLISQASNSVESNVPSAVIEQHYGELPLSFIPNVGQTDDRAQFQVNSLGGTLFFTPQEVVLSLPQASKDADRGFAEQKMAMTADDGLMPSVSEPPMVVKMQLIGANAEAEIVGSEPLPGIVNYFIGNDPSEWHANIPTYAGVVYRGVYAGIDLHYDGHEGSLKGTYTVAAGVDPRVISWRYEGSEGVRIDEQTGDLLIGLANGNVLREIAPTAWQEKLGKRKAIKTRYKLDDEVVRFEIGAYDAKLPLVVDPEFVYSTFLGGQSAEMARSIAIDSNGNAYVVGYTESANFPTSNPLQATRVGINDVFVTKLNATGTALLYSTYLGGSATDLGYGIAVDNDGNVFVTGSTGSADFPTLNPFQADIGGIADVFLAKLNATGSALTYSTYLGGSDIDAPADLVINDSGNAYLTGVTHSTDFPMHNPFQGTKSAIGDVFVTKVDITGSALVYSTYLGGNNSDFGVGIAIDSSNNAYITGSTVSTNFPTKNPFQSTVIGLNGQEAFVAKLNTDGNVLVYSTYLGGSSGEIGEGISVDSDGNAYIAGTTYSTDFPILNPYQVSNAGNADVFVTKLNADGNALLYSTYLGGDKWDREPSITTDDNGNAYIIGLAGSNFPIVNPIQATHAGNGDIFVTKLNAAGNSLVYSTYLGGSDSDYAYDVVTDHNGNVYITGHTLSTDFPIKNAYQPTYGGDDSTGGSRVGDAVVVKISDADLGTPTATNTITITPSITASMTASPTSTSTATPTSTFTLTPSATLSATASLTETTTPTRTSTPTATSTVIALRPDTIGIFRSSAATFYLRNSNTTGFADSTVTFGASTDFPITGDWNGDGIDTVGVYRRSTGQFFLTDSTTNPATLHYSFVLGSPNDQPIVGDWDGDGKDGVGVFRPSNGLIYLKNGLTTGFADFQMVLGSPGDVGIAGDWNGDGKDSPGVYRPNNQVFYLSNSVCNCSVFADAQLGLGIAGDTPFVGDWDGNGTSGVGVYRQSNGLTYIKNALTTGFADAEFVFGSASDYPLAGYWVRIIPPPAEAAPTFQPMN